jgi:glycosyltransferase involved in cell wall biosynthesis
VARALWLLNDGRIFGGGQLTTLRLATFVVRALPDRPVLVFCPTSSELARRCRESGVPVVDAQFPDLNPADAPRIPGALLRLRKVLGDADGDGTVVVGTSLRAHVSAHLASVGLRRPPPVVHLMVEQDSARRAFARLLLRRFGSVLVIEEGAAAAYRERLRGVPVTSVNNVLLPEEVEAAFRARSPRGEGAPVLGVLARLIPEKGVLELIEELAPCPRAWSRLLVAGPRQDEAYAARLETRIAALRMGDRVRLLGQITELAPFFAEIDALVVPSVGFETQPVVIMEALAHGRPALIRTSLWSAAFAGLPVLTYASSADLPAALDDLPVEAADPAELVRRFGPMQLLEGIDAAADAGS